MDVLATQAANKLKKIIGNKAELETETKENIVKAINEIKRSIVGVGGSLICHELQIQNVEGGEVRDSYMPFTSGGYIKGIKCTGNALTGDFRVRIYTKKATEGGSILYDSGTVNNVSWDIMEIPFIDESLEEKIYVVIENQGISTTFKLQIYVMKG